MIQKIFFIAIIILLSSCQTSKEGSNQQDSENSEQVIKQRVEEIQKELEFAYLLELDGKYAHKSELFDKEPMKGRLKELLGEEEYIVFVSRMEVQKPIEVNEEEVFMEGLMTHGGGTDEAAIIIDVTKNLLWVMIYSGGKNIQVYKDDRDVQMPKRFFDKVVSYK
ncbi:MAG: hypothetical protein ACJA1N_000176 [Saprospiraceae bacterium]|mgnify:CR=1 FL=1|jgi:hypothetical protein